MAHICVWPDGSVASQPREWMSDDYFLVEEMLSEVKLFAALLPHFGITHQLVDVMNTILNRQY